MFSAVLNFVIAIAYVWVAVAGYGKVDFIYLCACVYVALSCFTDGLLYLQMSRHGSR